MCCGKGKETIAVIEFCKIIKSFHLLIFINLLYQVGGVAQMVERLLSMREAMGSMPIISTFLFII